MKTIIKSILTICISYLGYFLGGFDSMMMTLLIFMGCDYISGILVAIKKKELDSKIGFVGIARKIFILLLVGLVNLLGNAIGMTELRLVAISFYIANEGISIVENASKFGIPIPKKIQEILSQLKNEGSDE